LLMLSVEQWFFQIRSIQERMLALNNEVNWVPHWMRERMQNWLEGISDWPVSRARYWGTPLPIWVCEKCGETLVVGSRHELEALSKKKGFEMHKPGIDDVKIPCKCGSEMSRVQEVLDVWFDAGVSSWAALGFPGEKGLFEKHWPADLNLEGTDQFRGWWNSQLILSTICFDKNPFKSILVHGIVLDLEKKKMSKSLGNIVQPKDVIEKYSRDYLRYYLVGTSRGEDFAFSWDVFKDIHRFFNVLWNAYNYACIYLEVDLENAEKLPKKGLMAEDKWILSRVNSLAEEVSESFEQYTFYKAASAVENFVLEDLSRTYIKLVRERQDENVGKTMAYVIDRLLRLLSPITPHITEYLYQHLKKGKMAESVHLLGLPKANEKLVSKKLEEEFERAKQAVQALLSLREENKLRRRWPLKEAVLVSKTGKELSQVKGVVAKGANVMKAVLSKKKPRGKYAEKEVSGIRVFLNLESGPELKENWELQELRRKIQDLRKQAKLMPGQKAKLRISCSKPEFLEKHKREIEESTNTEMLATKKKPSEKLLERKFGLQIVK